MLYAASKKQIDSEFDAFPKNVFVMADPAAEMVRKLGAMSSPRFYVIQNNNVLDVCEEVESWPEKWLSEVAKP